jgi:hypothetical protein
MDKYVVSSRKFVSDMNGNPRKNLKYDESGIWAFYWRNGDNDNKSD